MKDLKLLALLLLISTLLSAQQTTHPIFLWEVSGKDLPGKSYVFGSIHVNDPRAFTFGDSLYFALRSCQQFAAEVDMQQVDLVVLKEIAKEFEPTQETPEEEVVEEKEPFTMDVFDMQGKPTIMDCYLSRIAANMGLECSGLERMEDQIALIDDVTKTGEGVELGSPLFERLIKAYQSGDTTAISLVMNDEMMTKDLEMIKRNAIQAASFLKLAREVPTFAVVGAGHLVGSQSLLSILSEKGYQLRRVNSDNNLSRLDEVYFSLGDETWQEVKGNFLDISLQSDPQQKLLSFEGKAEFHLSMEFDKGLMYISFLVPSAHTTPEDFRKLITEEMFPERDHLQKFPSQTLNGITRQDYFNLSEKLAFKGRISISTEVSAMQLVMGFSHSALEHPHVDRYLDGLKIPTSAAQPVKEWATQIDEEGAFEYYYPSGIDYITNLTTYPSFEERGEIAIKYKIYIDPADANEYLVRFNNLPPGITFPDPYHAHRLMIEDLNTRYSTEIQDITFFTQDQSLGADAILKDEYNNEFYLRTLIRGSMMYLLVQKSPNHERMQSFFDGLKFRPVKFVPTETFHYAPAGFSMKSSAETYQTLAENHEETTFCFNNTGSGVTAYLEFEPVDPYTQLNLDDSIFTVENAVNFEALDTLLLFEPFKIEDTCPGYLIEYQRDSTFYFQTEMAIYCNQHFTKVTITAPQQLRGSTYVRDMLDGIKFDVNDRSLKGMTEDKGPLILQHLLSQDSTTFTAALAAFSAYEKFTEEDLPMLFKVLDEPLFDEAEDLNTKYSIITKLHDFTSEEVEQKLANYYAKTENDIVKARILESMAYRESETHLDRLFSLLEETDPDLTIPEDLYESFSDSLALFVHYYPKIRALAEQDIAEQQAIETIVYWMQQDTTFPAMAADSQWVDYKAYAQITQFYDRLSVDTSASIDGYLMDYVLLTDGGQKEEKLYRVLADASDEFGKYRTLYNKIKQGEPISSSLLDAVMKNDYYRYWTMVAFANAGLELPEQYTQTEDVAMLIMKYQLIIDEGYWCDSCSIVTEVSADENKVGRMLVVKCPATEEGTYYLGCIGPFDENGQFDVNNDQSAFFDTIQNTEDPSSRVPEFINHLNNK